MTSFSYNTIRLICDQIHAFYKPPVCKGKLAPGGFSPFFVSFLIDFHKVNPPDLLIVVTDKVTHVNLFLSKHAGVYNVLCFTRTAFQKELCTFSLIAAQFSE